jgi:adenosine deaminase
VVPEVQRQRDLMALPKAHLHLQLEGAMRPATLLELADRYGVPALLEGDGSFSKFIELYEAARTLVRTPDDCARPSKTQPPTARCGSSRRCG